MSNQINSSNKDVEVSEVNSVNVSDVKVDSESYWELNRYISDFVDTEEFLLKNTLGRDEYMKRCKSIAEGNTTVTDPHLLERLVSVNKILTFYFPKQVTHRGDVVSYEVDLLSVYNWIKSNTTVIKEGTVHSSYQGEMTHTFRLPQDLSPNSVHSFDVRSFLEEQDVESDFSSSVGEDDPDIDVHYDEIEISIYLDLDMSVKDRNLPSIEDSQEIQKAA